MNLGRFVMLWKQWAQMLLVLSRVIADLSVHLCGLRQLLPRQHLQILDQVHARLCGEGHQLTLQVTCVTENGAARVRHRPQFPCWFQLALLSPIFMSITPGPAEVKPCTPHSFTQTT